MFVLLVSDILKGNFFFFIVINFKCKNKGKNFDFSVLEFFCNVFFISGDLVLMVLFIISFLGRGMIYLDKLGCCGFF